MNQIYKTQSITVQKAQSQINQVEMGYTETDQRFMQETCSGNNKQCRLHSGYNTEKKHDTWEHF